MSGQDHPQDAQNPGQDVGFYADGTSGWAGGASSRHRAVQQDVLGLTGSLADAALAKVVAAGPRGITVGEMEYALGRGHGAVSGVLTRLQRGEQITRLTERRDRQEVYIHPDFVLGREVAPYRPTLSGSDRRRLQSLEQRVSFLQEVIEDAKWALDHGDAYRIRQALERASAR